jgi:hypothetical protein
MSPASRITLLAVRCGWRLFVVDGAHEVVVELGAGEVGVVGGGVALAAIIDGVAHSEL